MLLTLRVAPALLGAFLAAQQPQAFDLVLRGGTLVDGAARTTTLADLGIRDGRIAAIGSFEFAPGSPVLDLAGLHVAPGFVDLHAHVDSEIVRSPLCANFLRMGVTTLITGNCGGSVANLAAHYRRLEKGGIGVNYGSLIGHGTVRREVMGSENRAPTADELAQMRQHVEAAMQAGAFGLSTGLIYVPGTYATIDEIGSLAEVVGRYGGVYASHMRNEGDRMPDALAEAIAIGERGGCPVHVSHIKCSGKPNHGRASEMLSIFAEARANGLRISADQYAYDASSTGIDVLFPSAELAIGRDKFGKALQSDADFRARMKQALLRTMDEAGFGDFSYARIANAKGNEELNGMLLSDAAERRLGDRGRDAQAELAIELFARAAPSRVGMVYHKMADVDVDRFMSQDWIAVASDSGIRSDNSTSRPHPRGSGNNARVLARYVRDREVLDLPTAIHKMSSLPASLFGVVDRGVLRVGAFADLVVFDPATVQDRATYAEPVEPPTGITHVLVNGVIAVHDGELTGVRAGRVLRHAPAGANEAGR